ncbi:cytochrome c biogenesis protein transmembrane region [Thermaerobacter marianensis DSM 12885]|uniref:Cytochrome c biogenesis protein transmembrane region n=1 Tax=Thermaerobacter marianensis (strain ATCC 700841 / DSM 12885 / JCM 10246 / 7p75a) TaxID=644966 RepID=E6SJI8_THEM7|nr:cytochrome c biogenesis protein CcdA [Thermaerobacter marianensis]ADU52143.1 cytochrome c biogenesis protein transmembrane region [Thermaerobacter marianensis DSM 12885]
MTGAETQVTIGIAVLAGLAYFFSPCVWPLYPAYLAWLGGTAPGTGDPAHDGEGSRRDATATAGGGLAGFGAAAVGRPGRGAVTGQRAVASRRLAGAAGFVLGLGLVFMATGASLSTVGALLTYYRPVLEKIAGVLIVLFGLHMLGILRWRLLQREWRPGWARSPQTGGAGGFLRGTLMGTAFAVGWTPCVGPVLGSIMLLASSAGTVTQGMMLLAAFTAGFAVPFLTLAVLIDRLQPGWLRRTGPFLRRVEQASGVALVLLGVLVLTGRLAYLSSWLWYTLVPQGS